jgi:hypothetical protein
MYPLHLEWKKFQYILPVDLSPGSINITLGVEEILLPNLT